MTGIIFFGESCSGKSTIAKKLIEQINWIRYISSGDIARRINDPNINNGKLANETSMRIEILKEIQSDDKDFILDGCPRFWEQYVWLRDLLPDCRFVFFKFYVPFNIILCRAKKRGRDDDKSIMTKHRFWQEQTSPMIDRICGDGEIVYTFNNMTEADITDNVERIKDLIYLDNILKGL